MRFISVMAHFSVIPGRVPFRDKIAVLKTWHGSVHRHPRACPGDPVQRSAARGPRDEPGDDVGRARGGDCFASIGKNPQMTAGDRAASK
jgi:hypothetical protein